MTDDEDTAHPKTIKSSDVPVLDDLTAPTIVATGLRGIMEHDGFTTMNFMQMVFRAPGSPDEGPTETVAVRLAMPIPVFARVTEVFIEQRDRLIKDGKLVIDTTDGLPDA